MCVSQSTCIFEKLSSHFIAPAMSVQTRREIAVRFAPFKFTPIEDKTKI